MADMQVTIDRAALDRIVERQGNKGAHAAARFLANEQKKLAPRPELRAAIRFRSGRDARGFYARAGVMGFEENPNRWHRWTGSQWQVIDYPGRTTTPLPSWQLDEYGTPRTGARPFIRPPLFSNSSEVTRLLVGG